MLYSTKKICAVLNTGYIFELIKAVVCPNYSCNSKKLIIPNLMFGNVYSYSAIPAVSQI